MMEKTEDREYRGMRNLQALHISDLGASGGFRKLRNTVVLMARRHIRAC